MGATQTRLDDFGGGDVVVPVETAPTVAILTPADGAFFATGDVIPLTSQLADAEEPADSLHARWDVDVHHNVHVHPSSFTLFTRDAIFPAENHDDGTGYFLGIRLRATDRAGLVDTAEVRIYPDVDLDPSPVTVGPETLGAGRPAQFRFAIRNHGRMAAPYSRWALEVGTTTIGSGDTLVAPRDSAVFILTVIPNLTPGVHPVRLVADSLGAVHETDEANNASMGVVRVASSGVLVSDDRVPKRIALSSPHPNPSVGSVGFTLDLPRACRVSFTVHDPQGREVWSDAERGFAAGRWTLHWDGASNQVRHVRPGLYLARIVVEGVVLTRRIAIVR